MLAARARCRGSPGRAGRSFLCRVFLLCGECSSPQSQCSSPAHLQEHFPSNLNIPRDVPRRFNIPCFFHRENVKKRYFPILLCFSVYLYPHQPPLKDAVCLPFPLSVLLSLFKTLTYHSLLVTSQVSRWYFCTTLIGALEIAGREGGKISLKTSDALFDKWQLWI